MVCDARRLREATGWRPRHALETMLRDLLDARRAELADETR